MNKQANKNPMTESLMGYRVSATTAIIKVILVNPFPPLYAFKFDLPWAIASASLHHFTSGIIQPLIPEVSELLVTTFLRLVLLQLLIYCYHWS